MTHLAILFDGPVDGKAFEASGLGWPGQTIDIPVPPLNFDIVHYLRTGVSVPFHETVDRVRYRATRHRWQMETGRIAVAYVPEGAHPWG